MQSLLSPSWQVTDTQTHRRRCIPVMDVRKRTAQPPLTSITTTIKFLSFRWHLFTYANKDVCPKRIRNRGISIWRKMCKYSVLLPSMSYYEDTKSLELVKNDLRLRQTVCSMIKCFFSLLQIDGPCSGYWFRLYSLKPLFFSTEATQERRMRIKFTSWKIKPPEKTLTKKNTWMLLKLKRLRLGGTQMGFGSAAWHSYAFQNTEKCA